MKITGIDSLPFLESTNNVDRHCVCGLRVRVCADYSNCEENS